MQEEFDDNNYNWDVSSLRRIVFEKNKYIYTLLDVLYQKNKERKSWEDAASDLALKVVKLQDKIKQLEKVNNKTGWQFNFINN
jgi:hypothetical protein